MEITPAHQRSTDIDWFATDPNGHIAHFASGGLKLLPPSVAANLEDLRRLIVYFEQRKPLSDHRLDPRLKEEIDPANLRSGVYLPEFTTKAARGLFTYDIHSLAHPHLAYFRVALPATPLYLSDVPPEIRAILKRTHSPERFAATARIPHAATLEW